MYADSLLTKSDFEPEVFPHDPQGDPEKNSFQVDFNLVTIPLSPGARSQSDAASDRASFSKMKAGVL